MIFEDSKILARKIGELAIEAAGQALGLKKKIASGKVLRSLRYEIEVSATLIRVEVIADEGWQWIVRGRKRGGKFPMRKAGNRFVLVEPLEDWKRAIGFDGPDFLLARKIAQDGIRPVNLTEVVFNLLRPKITEAVQQAARENLKAVFKSSITKTFKQAIQ